MGDSVRLMLGDCLERMGEIEDGSVDLIAADLPYGTTACKWDAVIPFVPMWAAIRRVLSPRGTAALTSSQPFTSALLMSNPGWYRDEWIWWKDNGATAQNAPFRPIKTHEHVLIFSPAKSGSNASRPSTYNPQGIIPCSIPRRSRDGGERDRHRPGRNAALREYIQTATNFPRSILYFGLEHGANRRLHPTQKPVALFEYLIRTYSNEGETVLDCTMGSGTTGVACVNTDRRFIGIERDPGYFDIATQRITAAQSAHPLLAAAR